MKDYRLSEVKEICSKHKYCQDCELFDYTKGLCSITRVASPEYWEIDKKQYPKDNPENYKEINDKLC